MEYIALGILALLIGVFLFRLGWNLAVGRYRVRQDRLTQQYFDLHEGFQRDPARQGIDLGKEYAAHKMQGVIDELHAESDHD